MNRPADSNFVPDGNMESSGIVGWQPLYEPPLTLEKSTVQAHSGKQSLHVVLGASVVSGVQQWVGGLEPGRYYFEAWLKSGPPPEGVTRIPKCVIELQAMRGGEILGQGVFVSGDWEKHHFLFDLPYGSEGTLIRLRGRDHVQTEFWIDDLSLTKLSAQPVTGRVHDEDDNGIAGVQVSHRSEIAVTDSNGFYRFEAGWPGAFVSVTTPRGYRRASGFYARVPRDIEDNFTADFSLQRRAESDDVSFVIIGDSHLGHGSIPEAVIREDLAEICELDVDFIVEIGDTADHPDNVEQHRVWKDVAATSPLPVFTVTGNHDYPLYPDFFGPRSYSFDRGAYHFVAFNFQPEKEEVEWLWNDLSRQQFNKPTIVFSHYMTDEKQVRLMARSNVIALFTGHFHANRRFKHDNNLDVIATVTPHVGGSAPNPRAYRLVRLEDGSLKHTELIYGGVKKLLRIVSLAPFIVNAYDTTATIDRIICEIDGEDERTLTRTGKLCWRGDPGIRDGGTATIIVKAVSSNGETWEAEAKCNEPPGAPVLPKPGADWPMFQRDIAHTGATPDRVVPPLHLAWASSTGGSIELGSPVVAEGKVFVGVVDDENIDAAGIIALDAVSGEQIWKRSTDSSIPHAPVYADGLVYGLSHIGTVYAVDAETGELRWTHALGDPLNRRTLTSPAVGDGLVHVVLTGGIVVALDAETGTEAWKTGDIKNADLPYSFPIPARFENMLFFGAGSSLEGSVILGIDACSGEELWRSNEFSGRARSAVTIGAGKAFIGSLHDTFHAIDLATGALAWEVPNVGGTSSAAIAESLVYVGGDNSGKVVAIDAETGDQQWCFQTGRAVMDLTHYLRGGSAVLSSPAISGDLIYVGANDGMLHALDRASGQSRWDFDFGVPVVSSPAVSGNTVYVCALDGNVYAFVKD